MSEYERLKAQCDEIRARKVEKIAQKIMGRLSEKWLDESWDIEDFERIEEVIKNVLIEEKIC